MLFMYKWLIFSEMIFFNINDILPPSLRAKILFWLRLVVFTVSAVTVGAVVVDYGFVLNGREHALVQKIYEYSWWFYFFSFFGRLAVQWRSITRKAVFMTVCLGLLMLFTFLPKVVTLSGGWLVFLPVWNFFSNKYVLIAIISLFSMLELSKCVVNFINKKTNPALLMASCFAVIIVFGALLLLLPRSTHDGITLSIADAIFVSTSSVCVTGLTTVDVAHTFSYEGQFVIAMLIQVGGLGVMTITSFFAIFFMGGTGLYNQFALRDMVGSDTFNSLIYTLLYILGFTFVIEALGAMCIWLCIHGNMGMTTYEELFFSVFHSVSAFCNAGFSTLTGNLGSPLVAGNNAFFLIISLLVILGGIGFPILMNFKNVLFYYLGKLFMRISYKNRRRPRLMHLTNINTKIVLVTTSVLLLVGMFAIALLEWNGAFAGMSVGEKLVQALFNSVSPRTAGFNSVDIADFSLLTIIIYILLMWIGGASQSTAGGIKVNTFAVAIANFISVVKGREGVTLFNREVRSDSVRRASAVVFGSLITILTFFVLLLIMEPSLPPRSIFFEVVSAFSTVGSSLNLTPLFADDSKVLLSLLMFIGRVGLITVMMSFVQRSARLKYRLPSDNVIIN